MYWIKCKDGIETEASKMNEVDEREGVSCVSIYFQSHERGEWLQE